MRRRSSLSSVFSFTRAPNARHPVRELGDTAGAFRVPAAFTNLRRLEAGTQLDPRRLAQAVFGDSAAVARWLGHLGGLDVSYSRQRMSSFSRAGDFPAFSYQLGLVTIDAVRPHPPLHRPC